MRTGPRPGFASGLTVSMCAVLISGCVAVADGPSPTDPHHPTTTTAPPTTTTTVTLEERLSNFRECLADAGVVIDDIEFDGRGRPQLAPAMAGIDLSDRLVVASLGDCAPELAAGALDLTPDPVMRRLVLASLGEFASCVRANGVPDFPDPSPVFNGVGSPFPGALIPWTDEDLATAVFVCNGELARGS